MNKRRAQRPLILSAGIILIVTSISLQLIFTIPALLQERINKWSIDIPLDMSKANTYKKSFTPLTQYYACHTRFTMRGPVTEQFAAYHSKAGGNVPDEITENIFTRNPFKVSWQLLDGTTEVCRGEFLSSDIHIWVYPDYVHYGYSHFTGAGNLKPGIEYILVGTVEQPCESLNQFSPTLSLRRGASYKLRGIPITALFISIPAFLLGVILLIINSIKNGSKKNKVMS